MTWTPAATTPSPGTEQKPPSGSAAAPSRPLRFVPPAGWPEPDGAWVLTMQGWEPPSGWVPAPGLPAAPAGHVYWLPDPDRFPVEERPFRTQGGNRVVFGLAALAVAAVLLVGTAIGRVQLPEWVNGIVVPGIVALGVVSVVLGLRERARATGDAVATVAQGAAERRAGHPAVAYLPGAPAFGAVGNAACASGAAAVPKRVRRRSRRARRSGARAWQAIAAGLVVASLAWAVPSVVVLPDGGSGPVVALRSAATADARRTDSQSTDLRPTAAPGTARHDDGAVVIGDTVTVRNQGEDCLRTCWSWTVRATAACPSAVAHIDVGFGLDGARARVVRSADRRLGEVPAGTVLRYVEDRTPGQQARMTAVRCDGAPGPLVTATVRDVDDDALWAWRVTPRGSCRAATLTIERDEPADDGTTRVVDVAPLTAGVPLDLGWPRPPGAVTARLLPITC